MVKAELGTKRTCPSCAARFYDLMKNPIVCPKCNANFVAPSILPSKGDMPAMAPAPKPRVTEEADDMEVADVELVSLEERIDTGSAAGRNNLKSGSTQPVRFSGADHSHVTDPLRNLK